MSEILKLYDKDILPLSLPIKVYLFGDLREVSYPSKKVFTISYVSCFAFSRSSLTMTLSKFLAKVSS